MKNKSSDFRTGFLALIGPPNAGKSTLLNAVLKEKVAIVSAKPQTTRTRITGIHTTESEQIVFLDTPGIHTPRGQLNRFLVDAAWSALREAHGAILVLDSAKYSNNISALDRDLRSLNKGLQASGCPLVVALNKVDLVKPKELLLELLSACAERWPGIELVPVSAQKGDGLQGLLDIAREFLPVGDPLYPKDQLSTLPERFLAAEIIREKLFWVLEQELPYNIAVEIERWEEVPGQDLIIIHALILTSKNSHKGMIVGRQGQNLKKIGQAARLELKSLLGAKVHLELWVKVREGWTEDKAFMLSLGLGT